MDSKKLKAPREGEIGRGVDAVAIQGFHCLLERIEHDTLWTVDKWHDPQEVLYRQLRAGAPVSVIAHRFPDAVLGRVSFKGNCLLNEGINELWTLVCGTGATKFDNGNAYLGVGDNDTAADPADTGLKASTNKLYKAMDTSYPTYGASQKCTHRSTFGTSEANWAWKEYTVANGSSDSAKNLNRKVQSIGTKTSAMSWTLTQDVTLS